MLPFFGRKITTRKRTQEESVVNNPDTLNRRPVAKVKSGPKVGQGQRLA